MSSDQDTGLLDDGGVVVSVEITPSPTVPSSPVPSPADAGGQEWLAVTGFEPGWLPLVVAFALFAAGALVARRHRRALRRRVE